MSILKKSVRLLLAGVFGGLIYYTVSGAGLADVQMSGEAGFKAFCTACHFEGGNMIKPYKSLSKADREKNGIRTAQDIINLMRKPGEGMTVFDDKTVPEEQARSIADYILKTF